MSHVNCIFNSQFVNKAMKIHSTEKADWKWIFSNNLSWSWLPGEWQCGDSAWIYNLIRAEDSISSDAVQLTASDFPSLDLTGCNLSSRSVSKLGNYAPGRLKAATLLKRKHDFLPRFQRACLLLRPERRKLAIFVSRSANYLRSVSSFH